MLSYGSGARYYSASIYFQSLFREKIRKITLDGGFTCPNRDGTVDTTGCIFCLAGSSSFAGAKEQSLTRQIQEQISLSKKNHPDVKRYLAYLSAYTGTYDSISSLREKYQEILNHPKVAGLSIATRPDCLSMEVCSLLQEMNEQKPIFLELGLQTILESTAQRIHRGYPLQVFEDALARLASFPTPLPVVVHLIFGLPGESKEDMLQSVEYLNTKPIQGVKFQLLHVLKGTPLAKELPNLALLSEEDYLDLLGKAINRLRPDIVIHRLTGDGPREMLLAPLWSGNKKKVLNDIFHYLKENKIQQGKEWHTNDSRCNNSL